MEVLLGELLDIAGILGGNIRSSYIDEIIGLSDFILITGTRWTLMAEHCHLDYQ